MSESNKGSGAATSEDSAPKEINTGKIINESDHKRALDDMLKYKSQVKDLQSKLSEFEKKDKDAQEKKLAEAGEFQKIIAIKEAQLKEKEESEKYLRKTLFDAAKLNAITERLPGKLKHRDYASFIDLDKVALNPETNEISLDTVDAVVNDFVKSHPSLLETNPRILPSGAPMAPTDLSYDSWLKLPLKEKKARFKDVKR